MMNPDGVVVGNSRCNLSGADLNRKWDNPDPILHPEVFQVKNQIKKSHLNREVAIFCDFHGHSMKKHAFFYGCNKTSDGGASSWTQVRLIPRILSKKSPIFNINDCKYRVTEDKKNTARVICWNEIKISNSFTLETSFFGYDDIQNDGKQTHFTVQDFENLGKNLCESILEYTLIMESLTEELIQNNGWLKPFRLVQVTGESAQNKIIRNMKEQKKLEKQQRIQNNINCLLQEKEKQQAFIQQQLRQREKRSQTPQMQNGVIRGKYINNQTLQSENRSKSNFSSDEMQQKNNKYLEDDFISDNNVNTSSNDLIMQLCPDLKKDWRDYFGKDELEKNFKKIDRGEDPNDQESESGSDSEAEIDIFKGNELQLSNEAKNRKKAKKKKQFKKEIVSNAATIDIKTNNDAQADQGVNVLLDPSKKKRKSTTNAQSLEKNRWNPSPMIQNYKQQLELKKQQLKKQSYPISKIGSSYQYSQQNNQTISQQAQKGQVIQYQAQIPTFQQKMIMNGINLDQKLTETQFNELEQEQQFQSKLTQFQSFQHEQNQLLLTQQAIQQKFQQQMAFQQSQIQQKQQIYYNQTNLQKTNQNAQNIIYQTNNKFRQRKSVNSQIDERLSKFNSNFENSYANRLNTSDIQSNVKDKLYQNNPNQISSSRNYAKYLTNYSTQSSNYGQINEQNIEKYQKYSLLSQSNNDEYSNQENQNIYFNQNLEEKQQNQQDKQIINPNQYRRRTNSLIAMNSDNKPKSQNQFMITDNDLEYIKAQKQINNLSGEEFQESNKQRQYDSTAIKLTKSYNQQPDIILDEINELFSQTSQSLKIRTGSALLKKTQEIETPDNLATRQKNNKNQGHLSTSTSGKNSKTKIVFDDFSDIKRKSNVSEFNPDIIQIPHNFMNSASNNIDLELFSIQNIDNVDYSTNNKDINQQGQNNSTDNNKTTNEFTINYNNLDQIIFPKEISKNVSNFDKKIRAQAPQKYINSPDKINQIFPQSNVSNNTIMLNLNAQINDNLNSINQKNAERFNGKSKNNFIQNTNFVTIDKNNHRKFRTRSIQDGKLQPSIQSKIYGNTFNKLNTSPDQQQIQNFLQQSGNNFIPFKNLTSYERQPQTFQNNNIRIRKLNLQ